MGACALCCQNVISLLVIVSAVRLQQNVISLLVVVSAVRLQQNNLTV